MEKGSEILNELQIISPYLAEIGKVNVFQVPENYFEELPIKALTNIFLHIDEKNSDQQVPEGYFDRLSDKILLKIRKEDQQSAKEEISIISPILSSLKDKNVFTVPHGYFEKLGDSVHAKLKPGEAKIIPLSTVKKWWKYAAAAVIAGALTVGSFQIFNNKSNREDGNSVLTASIPDYIKLSFQYKTPEQLDQGIASLSDDEIATYLEKHGNIMDDEMLTNDIDANELPSPDDYLIDDSTLNNFLNTITPQDSNKNTQ